MIIIGSQVFDTKKSAQEHIRKILYGQPINTPLQGDDLTFVCDLLNLHPEKDTKIGDGIKSIIIMPDGRFGKTKHFAVVREDDSNIDFSFDKCLTKSKNAPDLLFKAAAREAIHDQIISFKKDYFDNNQDADGNVSCQISGDLINRRNSHVDHVPPNTFDKIVSDFIELNSIDVNKVSLIDGEGGIGRAFADDELREKFSSYHFDKIALRMTSGTANLRQKKR